jgi:serine/threonine-protein kinase RsbW
MFDNNPTLTRIGGFPADASAVGDAVAFTAAFCVAAALKSETTARLLIIVEELVANVVEYGGGCEDARIGLELAQNGQHVAVVLTDAGCAFDPTLADVPRLPPPERGGGAGIALVRSWATSMHYSRADGSNILRVVVADHG